MIIIMRHQFTNIIEAIKAVRSLESILIETVDTYGAKCFKVKADISLVDAKQLVEAIMEMAVKNYKLNNGINPTLEIELRKQLTDTTNLLNKTTIAYDLL